MIPADFSAKWDRRFKDNTLFLISEADLREFKDDLLLVFGLVGYTVPVYVPNITYAADYLVRYAPANGPEAFYYSLKAGKLPAPTGLLTDTNWKVVPGPVSATALWQALTRVQALNLEGNDVQAGRKYKVAFGPDAKGVEQYVYLEGLDKLFDTTRGVLEAGGVRTAIELVDLKAGTWQLAGTGTGGPATPIPGAGSGGFALLSADLATQTIVVAKPSGSSNDLADYCIVLAVPASTSASFFGDLFNQPFFG